MVSDVLATLAPPVKNMLLILMSIVASLMLLTYCGGIALRLWQEQRLRRRVRGYLVLTFDDGPGPVLTKLVAQQLADFNLAATFFVTGTCAQRHPEILDLALARGHEVGSHGFTHPNAWRRPWFAVYDQWRGLHALRQIHTAARLYRPAYGKTTLWSHFLCWWYGFEVVMWTIDVKDTMGSPRSDDDVLDQLRRDGGGVVLMHDLDLDNTRGQTHRELVLRLNIKLIALAHELRLRITTYSKMGVRLPDA